MDVLIAHRGETSRKGLAKALKGRGYDLITVDNGDKALEFLLAGDAPRVAIVDWDLPAIEGPELCRLVRDFHLESPPYVILLASATHHSDVALGLEAGANDCVRTPVAGAELRARVEMGRRLVELPWGRPCAAGAGARLGEIRGLEADEGLQAFIEAEPPDPDGRDGGARVELEALHGDLWLTA